MPDTTPLIVARDGAVVTLQFNRPESLNALDVPTAQAFLAAMRAIATDGSVRAVVLKGSGRAFIAGGDLAAMSAAPRQTVAELLGTINEAVLLMQRIDAPIIAQVHGVAAGGGIDTEKILLHGDTQLRQSEDPPRSLFTRHLRCLLLKNLTFSLVLDCLQPSFPCCFG